MEELRGLCVEEIKIGRRVRAGSMGAGQRGRSQNMVGRREKKSITSIISNGSVYVNGVGSGHERLESVDSSTNSHRTNESTETALSGSTLRSDFEHVEEEGEDIVLSSTPTQVSPKKMEISDSSKRVQFPLQHASALLTPRSSGSASGELQGRGQTPVQFSFPPTHYFPQPINNNNNNNNSSTKTDSNQKPPRSSSRSRVSQSAQPPVVQLPSTELLKQRLRLRARVSARVSGWSSSIASNASGVNVGEEERQQSNRPIGEWI